MNVNQINVFEMKMFSIYLISSWGVKTGFDLYDLYKELTHLVFSHWWDLKCAVSLVVSEKEDCINGPNNSVLYENALVRKIYPSYMN